jgi:hypothetical protein
MLLQLAMYGVATRPGWSFDFLAVDITRRGLANATRWVPGLDAKPFLLCRRQLASGKHKVGWSSL